MVFIFTFLSKNRINQLSLIVFEFGSGLSLPAKGDQGSGHGFI